MRTRTAELTEQLGNAVPIDVGVPDAIPEPDRVHPVHVLNPYVQHNAGIERHPEVFDIDMSRCMFCGLCEEACPEEAIVMSRDVELATYERGPMLFHKADLLRNEEQLGRRIGFIRTEYAR